MSATLKLFLVPPNRIESNFPSKSHSFRNKCYSKYAKINSIFRKYIFVQQRDMRSKSHLLYTSRRGSFPCLPREPSVINHFHTLTHTLMRSDEVPNPETVDFDPLFRNDTRECEMGICFPILNSTTKN